MNLNMSKKKKQHERKRMREYYVYDAYEQGFFVCVYQHIEKEQNAKQKYQSLPSKRKIANSTNSWKKFQPATLFKST